MASPGRLVVLLHPARRTLLAGALLAGALTVSSAGALPERAWADLRSGPAGSAGISRGAGGLPPAIDPIPDQFVREGGVVHLTANASDPEMEPITFSYSPPLPWVIQVPGTGEFTIAPGYEVAGAGGAAVAITIHASDGLGESFTTFTVNVANVTTVANTPWAGRTWHGVSLLTGELVLAEEPDVCLGGPMPLCFGRTYASLREREGIGGSCGRNWLGTYDWRLTETPGEATVVDHRGRVYRFASAGPGLWTLVEPLDAPYQLTESGAEMSFAHVRHRAFYIIDRTTTRLARIEDGRGNAHTLSYQNGLLQSVSDGLGRSLVFTHDPFGRMTEVSDGTRSVTYGYAGDDLTSFTDAAGKTTLYEYDLVLPVGGLLTARQDPAGNRPLTYQYTSTDDCDACVTSVVDAGLSTVAGFLYGPAGDPMQTQASEPGGVTHTYSHDGFGRLESRLDALGGTTSWGYDAQGRPILVTRPSGSQPAAVTYDPLTGFPATITLADASEMHVSYVERFYPGGRFAFPVMVEPPDQTLLQFDYDASGNLIRFTDQAGHTWEIGRNGFGQPTTITNPTQGIVTNSYDPQGRLTSVDDGLGVTQFSYDALDRLVSVTRPDASTLGFTWDACDRLLSRTDELGKTWTFEYLDNGQLLRSHDPLLATTEYAYDALNRLVRVTDALSGQTDFGYDPNWRLSSVADPTGRGVSYDYDGLNRLVSLTDPASKQTTRAWDADGRLLSVTDPLLHTWTYSYDARDRVTAVTDPLSHTTTYAYDAMNRITLVQPPAGPDHSYQYDLRGLLTTASRGPISVANQYSPMGRLLTHTDGEGHLWNWSYDAHGRPLSATDPLQRSVSYDYDARGRIVGTTHPEGSAVFGYDAASRLVYRWFSDGTAHSYTYDDLGRLLSTEGASFAYDALGRTVEENGVASTRDAHGRLLTQSYAPGRVVSYRYESRGLLEEVEDWLGGITHFDYDDAGRLAQTVRPNGTATQCQYDAANRLLSLTESGPAGPLASVTLTRDALGRVTTADRQMPQVWSPPTSERMFDYDAASQIVGFAYDGLGRRTADDRHAYAWDGACRLTELATGPLTKTYVYDGLDRMIRVDPPAPPIMSLALGGSYGPRGRRLGFEDDPGLSSPQPVPLAVPGNDQRPQQPYRVFQPVPSLGGSPAEPMEGFHTRVAERLRHKDRAITLWDYERLVLEQFPEVYKIRCVNVSRTQATPADLPVDHTYWITTPGGLLLHSIDVSGVVPEPRYYHFDEQGNTSFLTDAGGAMLSAFAYSPSGELAGPPQAYPPFTWRGRFGVILESDDPIYRDGPILYDALSLQSLTPPGWPGEPPAGGDRSGATGPGVRNGVPQLSDPTVASGADDYGIYVDSHLSVSLSNLAWKTTVGLPFDPPQPSRGDSWASLIQPRVPTVPYAKQTPGSPEVCVFSEKDPCAIPEAGGFLGPSPDFHRFAPHLGPCGTECVPIPLREGGAGIRLVPDSDIPVLLPLIPPILDDRKY